MKSRIHTAWYSASVCVVGIYIAWGMASAAESHDIEKYCEIHAAAHGGRDAGSKRFSIAIRRACSRSPNGAQIMPCTELARATRYRGGRRISSANGDISTSGYGRIGRRRGFLGCARIDSQRLHRAQQRTRSAASTRPLLSPDSQAERRVLDWPITTHGSILAKRWDDWAGI